MVDVPYSSHSRAYGVPLLTVQLYNGLNAIDESAVVLSLLISTSLSLAHPYNPLLQCQSFCTYLPRASRT